MGAYRNEGPITVTSGEALVADRFCLLTSSTAKYADAGEAPVGLSTEPVATATQTTLRLLTGTIEVVTASKAISANDDLYVTADGKVSDAAVGTQIGIAVTAATADGGKISAIIWGVNGGSNPLISTAGQIIFEDEFFQYDATATVGKYKATSDGGTVGIIDANGGVLSIATTGTIEDETYIASLFQVFAFQTDKSGFFEAHIKLTEANTDDANIIIGLSDTVGANSLLDAGAGPMASYDGAVLYKVLDGTVWNFECSNAGTQDTELSVGAFTDATDTTLGFRYDYNDGVTCIITPYVNGVAGTAAGMLIAGLAEMNFIMGVKAGSGNAETLLVDRISYTQDR